MALGPLLGSGAMADIRPLLYVASVVIAGLAIWVISVLARPGEPWEAKPPSGPGTPADPVV